LLLDNFEHLVPAAPLLTTLLSRCPELKMLVTSRQMLHLYGEQTYPVPPLSLPDAGFQGSAAQARAYEAVQLFLERAAVAQPNLVVDNRAIAYVAEICTRLDGLPLAIELAAARLRLYEPATLAAQLSHRFELLRRGSADLPARQRTLLATVDWSYETLNQDEKTLFARLAVFQGGRSLEAIEAVCAYDLDADVIDAVESLRDKSLLRQERGTGGEPRFAMLETIHDYARQKLQERGEREDTQRRHATWVLALAEKAEPHLRGGRYQLSWLHRLEDERDNIRVALEWALGGGDVDLGVRLTTALHFFWLRSGHFEDIQQWTSRAFEVADGADPPTRARLQLMQGGLAFFWQKPGSRKETLREAEAVFRQYGDTRETAYALMWRAIHSIGNVPDYEEDLAAAEEALLLLRSLDDKIGIAQALNVIGEVARAAGHDGRAEDVYHEALALSREIGDRYREFFMYVNLGFTAEHKGEHQKALSLTRQGIVLARQMEMDYCLPCAFAALAGPLCSLREAPKAATLLGAAAATGEQLGVVLQPSDQVEIDCYETAIRAQLDESAFTAAWEAGRALALEEVVALAMS
jgi:predicted ATPase